MSRTRDLRGHLLHTVTFLVLLKFIYALRCYVVIKVKKNIHTLQKQQLTAFLTMFTTNKYLLQKKIGPINI